MTDCCKHGYSSLAHGPAEAGWLMSCVPCHIPQPKAGPACQPGGPGSHQLITYPSFIPLQHSHQCWVLPGPSASWTQHPTGTSPCQGAAPSCTATGQARATRESSHRAWPCIQPGTEPRAPPCLETWLPVPVAAKLPLGKVFSHTTTTQVSLEQSGTCQHCAILWATSQGLIRWPCGVWKSPAQAMCSPPTALPRPENLVAAWHRPP